MSIVIFLHGLESGPEGFKIQAMRRVAESMGWSTLAPDFRGMPDPEQRTQYLLKLLPVGETIRLVGSSLGGYVAARTVELASSNLRIEGVFLLCPAFDLPGYPLARPAQQLRGQAVRIVHGRHDEVVPLAHSLRAAEAWQCPLLVTEDDHPVHKSIELISSFLADWLSQKVLN
jgi:pimeloyl-ACP methyl ester carboxylesterase